MAWMLLLVLDAKKDRLLLVAVVLPMNRGSPVTVKNDKINESI